MKPMEEEGAMMVKGLPPSVDPVVCISSMRVSVVVWVRGVETDGGGGSDDGEGVAALR